MVDGTFFRFFYIHRPLGGTMGIRLPFYYTDKYLNSTKISVAEESSFWVDLQDTINNLISRCNSLNAKSMPLVTRMVNPETKGSGLSAIELDSNLSKFENAANLLIINSSAQGLNQSNTVELIKRSSKTRGLSTFERDTNCLTIQTFINTLNKLYS